MATPGRHKTATNLLRHELTDPETQQLIPGRVLFVHSSADEATGARRAQADQVVFARLAAIAATVARGHSRTTQATIARRVTRLFGYRAAAQFFRWEMVP